MASGPELHLANFKFSVALKWFILCWNEL